jgi:hypothetical protein
VFKELKFERSSKTHKILDLHSIPSNTTVAATVSFGTGGDSDQYLGVVAAGTWTSGEPSYTKMKEGWGIKQGSGAFVSGTAKLAAGQLKGKTTTMAYTHVGGAGTLSFWCGAKAEGDPVTRIDALPSDVPLTFALGLYDNDAKVERLVEYMHDGNTFLYDHSEYDGNTFLCDRHDPFAGLRKSLGVKGVAAVGGEAALRMLAVETGCETRKELLALSAQAMAGLGAEAQAGVAALKQHVLSSSLGVKGVAAVGGKAFVRMLAVETGCETREGLLALRAQALAGLGAEAQAGVEALRAMEPCRREVRGTELCTCGGGCKCRCKWCGDALPKRKPEVCSKPLPPSPQSPQPQLFQGRGEHTRALPHSVREALDVKPLHAFLQMAQAGAGRSGRRQSINTTGKASS